MNSVLSILFYMQIVIHFIHPYENAYNSYGSVGALAKWKLKESPTDKPFALRVIIPWNNLRNLLTDLVFYLQKTSNLYEIEGR